MPTYIIKLDTPVGPRYMAWSTIVDAPVTYGLTLEEFKSYYQEEYGRQGMFELDGRLDRVERFGTSCRYGRNADELIKHNRAGKDETCLSRDQIIDYYCIRRDDGDPPVGADDDR